MKQEFFTFLPSEIIIDILSRLPVRTITHCKCVCKSWLDLIETHEFAKSHHSKSVPNLTVYELGSKMYKIFEFEELVQDMLQYNPFTEFYLPLYKWMFGSSDGLFLLCDRSSNSHSLCVCNPISREYVNLDSFQESFYPGIQMVTFGFGSSKMTGQHKVVRLIHGIPTDQETCVMSECDVYTLETGSWRRIAPPSMSLLPCGDSTPGSFLLGNLHWLAFDSHDSLWILC